MLIGQDRSGKTSLKKSLQGLRFNPDENSTDGMNVDPSYFKVTTEIWKIGKNDQEANKDEISSGAAHVVGGSRIFQTTENYPAPTKPRGTASSGMIPREIEKLLGVADKVDSEDDIYSVLWDFAGESVYYETHQLFLTSRAIYLLVYDLSRDPEQIALSVRKQGVFGKIKEKWYTCLLYTSPSPRDGLLSRMPSSA